ncbi:hypothetical protein CAPTEDRAFT_202491, partial [Capitella teleta]
MAEAQGLLCQVIVRNATAPSRRNPRGFQEVEFQPANPSPSHSEPTRNMWNHQGLDRQDTTASEFEQPQYEDTDDMILETFYHQDGSSYTCAYQGGQRFLLDSSTQDWHPFPKSWYKQGVLVTDVPTHATQESGAASASQVNSGDDREGFIMHPKKGRLPTYIFEEKRNVHYFFDKDNGCWVRLPISWELHSESIVKLVNPIEEALPDWKDRHDILAALRVSNYDPHDCIATYLTIGDHGALAAARRRDDNNIMQAKDEQIKEHKTEIKKLKKKLDKVMKSLAQSENERQVAEAMVETLNDRVSSLEVIAATSRAQMEASERPKTAASRHHYQDQVDAQTVIAVHQSTQDVHKDHVKLRMEVERRFTEVNSMMQQARGERSKFKASLSCWLLQLNVYVGRISRVDTGQSTELAEMKELYQREALQRKLLYNK